MKKNKIIKILISVFIIVTGFNLYDKFTDDMYGLPKGEYIEESTSPNGRYTVKTYLCNGGATVDWAVRGELITNSIFKNKRNIYWQYKTTSSHIIWDDNKTVEINGIKIDLPKGKYDYRVDE